MTKYSNSHNDGGRPKAQIDPRLHAALEASADENRLANRRAAEQFDRKRQCSEDGSTGRGRHLRSKSMPPMPQVPPSMPPNGQ
ncbi:hypothetical protein E2F47_27115 [Mycobacterium eburneum]|nr:hypothetical protein [Mycobacterium eburneum]TDH46670.1 hypothetical protein E2F47_27115 [Mycobacterium eburneum]